MHYAQRFLTVGPLETSIDGVIYPSNSRSRGPRNDFVALSAMLSGTYAIITIVLALEKDEDYRLDVVVAAGKTNISLILIFVRYFRIRIGHIFRLRCFHCRLSKRVTVDIDFPGKFNILGVGESVEVQEKEHRDIAYLTRRTLRLAAGGFFVAFIISLYQSISTE
ncbi:MAG: hypothetical protein ACXVIB_07370 [Halobacteriota archaeon]